MKKVFSKVLPSMLVASIILSQLCFNGFAADATPKTYDVFDATHKAVFSVAATAYNGLTQTSNLKFGQVESNTFTAFESIWGLDDKSYFQNQAYYSTDKCYMAHIDNVTWQSLWLNRLTPTAPNPAISFNSDYVADVSINATLGSNNGAKVRITKNETKIWPETDWKELASSDSINATLEGVATSDSIVVEFTNGDTYLTSFTIAETVALTMSDLYDAFDAGHKSLFASNAVGNSVVSQTSKLQLGQIESNAFYAFSNLYAQSATSIYTNLLYFNSSNTNMEHFDHGTWQALWVYKLAPEAPNPAFSLKAEYDSNVTINATLGTNTGAKVRVTKNGIKVWPTSDWRALTNNEAITAVVNDVNKDDEIILEFSNGNTYVTALNFLSERMVGFANYKSTGNYITKVAENSKVSDILSTSNIKLGTLITLKVFGVNGVEYANQNDQVGTGTAVKIYNNGIEFKTYKIVVYGDITSDGKILIGDLVALKEKMLNLSVLTNEKLMACDTDKSGSVTISDLLTLKKHLLSIKSISQ
jgi:hypothetical protein